jgi:hypothetical protein
MNDTISLPPTIIPKPRHGMACNGCGLCCTLEPCGIAKALLGDIPGPCPILVYQDGKYRCGYVLMEAEARAIKPDFEPLITNALGIGKGCDAED